MDSFYAHFLDSLERKVLSPDFVEHLFAKLEEYLDSLVESGLAEVLEDDEVVSPSSVPIVPIKSSSANTID